MQDSDCYRFLIKSVSGGLIEVAWSRERDHHPVAVGTVHVSADLPVEEPLAREAQAYVAEWRRITGRTI